MTRFLSVPVLVAAALLGGCSNFGEAGNGGFSYRCVDGTDALCDTPCGEWGGCSTTRDAVQAFEDFDVALGATMDVRYNIGQINAADTARLARPVDPLTGASQGGAFRANKGGWVALLGEGARGQNDIVHVFIADIVSLELGVDLDVVEEGAGPLELGGETRIQVRPLDAEGNVLIGALPTRFEVADESIAEIGSGSNNAQDLRSIGQGGETTLTVTVGDVSRSVQVIVPPSGGTR